ncbi:exosortase F system-associated membrane protein [Fulvivirga sediminis]|uniref:Exosortase F system-associated protein n=1 Tax=Fulvivirga sediminis TaxID=2803949 RepID=A0A937JXD2_9BACT|nr:exosortase F system-associated protein [Fulvivirga sediminis]
MKKLSLKPFQIVVLILATTGLLVVYLFQKHLDHFLGTYFTDHYWSFVLTKSIRFILNDLLMIAIIYALFAKRKYVVFAFYIQLAGVVCILLPYLIIKYHTSYNGPLVSYLHRLVVNPLLMLLLIPAIFYQENNTKLKS